MIKLRSEKYRRVIVEDIQEKIKETSKVRDELRMALDENKVWWIYTHIYIASEARDLLFGFKDTWPWVKENPDCLNVNQVLGSFF